MRENQMAQEDSGLTPFKKNKTVLNRKSYTVNRDINIRRVVFSWHISIIKNGCVSNSCIHQYYRILLSIK